VVKITTFAKLETVVFSAKRDRANADPQTTHLKIPLADPLPKFLKELFFLLSHKEIVVII
jgi:hypothetical protein